MKAETLKKAILQYAMQGKLVEQNPNDEPASILLERIKAEKEQLIKDGKIKKEKPLPTITEDEIPYELPKGWVWVRLGNIINISSGRFLPSNEMKTKGTIPVYGGNGINGYHNEYLIDKPTLIIGRVGFYCGCVHLSTDKAWVTDNAFITTFSENNININFLKWLLIASDLGKNDNATAQPVVSGKKIYPLVVALPPLAEQERIVEKLEQILPFVEEYGKNEEKLFKLDLTLPDKVKQSILQHAVQGKLVPQNPSDEPASELLKRIKAKNEQIIKGDKIKKEIPLPPIIEDKIPYKLPQSWEWVRLCSICEILNGYAFKSDTYVSKSSNQIIRLGNVKNSGLILEASPVYIPNNIAKTAKRYLLKRNDILVTLTGTRLKRDYFYTSLVESKDIKFLNLYLNQRVGCLRFYSEINPRLLNIFLKSKFILNNIFEHETGTANQGNIGTVATGNLLIPLPPLAEQRRIVTKVEELLAVVESLKV